MTNHGLEPIDPHRPQGFSYCADHMVIDCADCAGQGGWISGSCDSPAAALEAERAADKANDLLSWRMKLFAVECLAADVAKARPEVAEVGEILGHLRGGVYAPEVAWRRLEMLTDE